LAIKSHVKRGYSSLKKTTTTPLKQQPQSFGFDVILLLKIPETFLNCLGLLKHHKNSTCDLLESKT
jgi:hypothetical protein